ncbi:MAG: O-methyltransferase, partial [Bacilli bacterium]
MVESKYIEIKELKEYATNNNVPIMLDKGLDFLTSFILKNNINRVLEIGTAIGYSAIIMALTNPNLKVTSIERDNERYLEALKNIKKFNLEDRITLIFKDALEVNLDETYDLLFIDAAKGQNINFFKRFIGNIKQNGFVITDNMEFHGLVAKDENEIKSRNLRGLIRKIKEYIVFLNDSLDYETSYYSIGDGLAVT